MPEPFTQPAPRTGASASSGLPSTGGRASIGGQPGSRGSETYERILEAAETCFAERGFAGTTLRDVASVVGIRIPSLYNHFPSKAELYKAVLARAIGSIQAVLDRIGSGELTNESRDVIGPMMDVLRARPNVPKLIQYELLSGGQQLALVLEDFVQPALGSGAAALDEVSGVSRWKPEQRPLLLIAFYNLLIGHFTSAPLFRVMTGEDPDSPDAIERQNVFFQELVSVLIGAGGPGERSAEPLRSDGAEAPVPQTPKSQNPKE